MKKLLTLTAAAALAAVVFADTKAPEKGSCCGSCQKDAAVKQACTTEGSCKTKACKTKECKTACAEKKSAEKTQCSGGSCPLSK